MIILIILLNVELVNADGNKPDDYVPVVDKPLSYIDSSFRQNFM